MSPLFYHRQRTEEDRGIAYSRIELEVKSFIAQFATLLSIPSSLDADAIYSNTDFSVFSL